MTYTTMWLVICGSCLIAEIFTVSFLLFFPGVGAFLAFVAALLGASITVQALIFVVSSTLMIVFVRPIVTKFFKTKDVKMNSEALVGKTGVVLKEIDGTDVVGQVKVAGEVWSAVCKEGTKIAKDAKVTVLEISGVKLIVEQIDN